MTNNLKVRQLEKALRHFNLDVPQRTYERLASVFDEISHQKEDLDDIKRGIFKEDVDGMEVEKDIPLVSYCEHHIMPFFGFAHIAYIAHGHVLGLSKFTRIVNYYAVGLQLQERITKNIADFFEKNLSDSVMVMTEAVHSCMVARGVRNPFTTSIFLEARGQFRVEEGPRLEFFHAMSSSHFNSGR